MQTAWTMAVLTSYSRLKGGWELGGFGDSAPRACHRRLLVAGVYVAVTGLANLTAHEGDRSKEEQNHREQEISITFQSTAASA